MGSAPVHDIDASSASARSGACTRAPEEVKGPYFDLCLSPGEVEAFAAMLREAVAHRDSVKVASLVRYPFRVHTADCMKHLTTPDELVAHYDEVFTPSLQSDIASMRPPFFVRDESIMLASSGRAWAWVSEDRRLLLGGVFLGEGDLASVPCADRAIEPIPEAVWGTWAVSSVRAGALEELVSFPWQDWKRLTISLDRRKRTLTSALGARQKECNVLWFARDTSPEPSDAVVTQRCSAFETFWGPRSRERSHLLRASCPGGDLVAGLPVGTGVPPELIVLDERTMVLRLGCEGIAILKKRSSRVLATGPRLVQKGAECGAPDVDCAPGARCVALSAHPLVERCKALDEAAE